MRILMSSLSGKVILVTGAAQGLGAAGATLFAELGGHVVLSDIRPSEIANNARKLTERGLEAWAVPMDVTDAESVRKAVAEIVSQFGRIDGLFHNAMSAEYVNNNDWRITELRDEVWDRIIDLVLTGTYRVLKAVCQVMLKQKSGSVVLTATVDAIIGQAGIDAYSAAKGGVISLTRSAAAGLSPEGIRINSICPSFMTTPDQTDFLDNPQQRVHFEGLHLMDIPTPMDVANYAAFLLSDAARIVTGAIHMVDSGYSCFKGKLDLRERISTS
jgi:NAD(P)-dependent dehydrogenase (short-subunit alcohol dehydrogenase family)